MRLKKWEDFGIENEDRFRSFNYNELTGVMIAQFTKNITDKSWLQSIYTRNRDSNTYKRLTEKSKLLSYDDPVTGSKSKYLYFNILEWNKRGKHYGGDWLKTQRVNLETLEFDNSFSSEGF